MSAQLSVTIQEPSSKIRHLKPDRKVIAELIATFLRHFGIVGNFSGSLDVQRDKHAGVAVTWVGVKNRRPNIRVRPPTGSVEWTVSLGGGHLITEDQIREIEACTCSYEEVQRRPPHVHHDPNPLERLVAGMDDAVTAAVLLFPTGFIIRGENPTDFRVSGAFLLTNLADHDLAENLIHTLAEAGVVTAIGTNTNGPSSRVWSYNHTAWLVLYDELARQGKVSSKDIRLETPVLHDPPTDPTTDAIQKLDGEIHQEEERAARLRQEADEAEAEIGRNDVALREAEAALERLRQTTKTNNGRLRVTCDRNRERATTIDGTLAGMRAKRRNLDEIRGINKHLAEIDQRTAGKALSAIDPGDLRLVAELRGRLTQIQL